MQVVVSKNKKIYIFERCLLQHFRMQKGISVFFSKYIEYFTNYKLTSKGK